MKRIIFIFSILLSAVIADAQVITLYNSTYTTIPSDSTVNTGVGAIGNVRAINSTSGTKVTVQFVATKISGTVAGTVSLLGSIDGVNYKAILLEEVATALNTYTATDVASQTFAWRLLSNPYPFYRVSWAGTGTMSASFTGKLLIR